MVDRNRRRNRSDFRIVLMQNEEEVDIGSNLNQADKFSLPDVITRVDIVDLR